MNRQKMTVQQAISILEQITAQVKLTRAEHAMVLKALETLQEALK